MRKIVLNLGVGDLPVEGAVGVDLVQTNHVDQVCDLRHIPWPFMAGSADGIYMIHTLEHFHDTGSVLKECHRVLKPGGFLYLQVPHATCSSSLAPIDHYKEFTSSTMHPLEGELFEKKLSRIFFAFQPRDGTFPYVPFGENDKQLQHPLARRVLKPVIPVIQWLIDRSPALFERVWWAYVGGAEEFVWKGTKLECANTDDKLFLTR